MKVGDPVKIKLGGRIVSESRTLRGVLDYARKQGVKVVQARKRPSGQGLLTMVFMDGARVDTYFASYGILCEWIRDRAKRSWGGVTPYYVDGDEARTKVGTKPENIWRLVCNRCQKPYGRRLSGADVHYAGTGTPSQRARAMAQFPACTRCGSRDFRIESTR